MNAIPSSCIALSSPRKSSSAVCPCNRNKLRSRMKKRPGCVVSLSNGLPVVIGSSQYSSVQRQKPFRVRTRASAVTGRVYVWSAFPFPKTPCKLCPAAYVIVDYILRLHLRDSVYRHHLGDTECFSNWSTSRSIDISRYRRHYRRAVPCCSSHAMASLNSGLHASGLNCCARSSIGRPI